MRKVQGGNRRWRRFGVERKKGGKVGGSEGSEGLGGVKHRERWNWSKRRREGGRDIGTTVFLQ